MRAAHEAQDRHLWSKTHRPVEIGRSRPAALPPWPKAKGMRAGDAEALDDSEGRAMPGTAELILEQLVALFPGFRGHWDNPGNCFREDDGSFTSQGVFAEFSGYF